MKNDSSSSYSSSSSSLLRWVTLGVLLCVVGIAVVMESSTPWSAEIKERVREDRDKLGSPVLFAELARSREDFARVFGPAVVVVPQSAVGAPQAGESEDLKSLRRSLFLDYFFIVAYTALLFVLGLRSWNIPPGQRAALGVWLLLIVPPVIGVCDVMENAGIANSLDHLREGTLTNGMITTTRWWSMTKWQLYFVNLLLLAWSFIGAEPWRWGRRDCPVLLRRAAALLLAVGAVVGFGGLALPRLVPTGFGIGLLAMTPVLLMLVWWPDGAWRRRE